MLENDSSSTQAGQRKMLALGREVVLHGMKTRRNWGGILQCTGRCDSDAG